MGVVLRMCLVSSVRGAHAAVTLFAGEIRSVTGSEVGTESGTGTEKGLTAGAEAAAGGSLSQAIYRCGTFDTLHLHRARSSKVAV